MNNKTIKYIIRYVLFFGITFQVFAQDVNVDSIYSEAMKEYEIGNFKKASEKFNIIINEVGYKLSKGSLYNGACIYALNNNIKKSIGILEYLTNEKYYSNLGHITTDSDLDNLHRIPEWTKLIKKVKLNKETLPERNRKLIKSELLKAKKILAKDNGKLWGKNIWSDNILVLDFENVIYRLQNFPGSITKDSVIFYKKIPENTLGFSNSAQKYNGKDYAVVLTNSLNDSSSTIIHELFHILHHKHKTLGGNPVTYLDNYDAREWLRLEYQALRNTLKSINENEKRVTIETFIKDAFMFRKIRQTKYIKFLKNELEIETLEGLANYTGFVLSAYPNKYLRIISEITGRENATTYTRPFCYATGPAYGLIFDYLNINWRAGLKKVYNFLEIYEVQYLKRKLDFNKKMIVKAKVRNNFKKIHKEELIRKTENEKNIKYYMDILIIQPTLTVSLADSLYGQTYDMNGTIVLKDKGIVFSMLKGTDGSKNNFGNFFTISGKEKLGVSGILNSLDGKTFTFPLPIKIEGNKIIGEFYEIDLNDGWEVQTINEKGDLEIVKKI